MNKDIAFFDSFADTWDSYRNTNVKILEQLMVLANIHAGSTVFDVGSGTGVLLPYLHATVGAQGKITAIDFSEKMLAKAQEKFANLSNVDFIVGDVLEMNIPAESINVVICLNFFPHLHTRKEEFIRKMKSSLKNGGSLIIMHDISRAKVNSIHRDNSVVTEHRLPESKLVGEMLKTCGYKEVTAYEDDTLYFVKGFK